MIRGSLGHEVDVSVIYEFIKLKDQHLKKKDGTYRTDNRVYTNSKKHDLPGMFSALRNAQG